MAEGIAQLHNKTETIEGSNISERRIYTVEEYLQMEDEAAMRHEFHNGIITAMAGGTVAHNLVKGRIYSLLDRSLEDLTIPYVPLNSDTKVWLPREQRFVYPDITVSDGRPQYYTTAEGVQRRDIITNPLVVVEVLSESTRLEDKGEKFERYCNIPTFREYILVEPELPWIRTYHLQDPAAGLWKIQLFSSLEDTFNIYTIDCALNLKDIYSVLAKLDGDDI